ncbi:glycoside hydrolase family 65 protein [Enterococcus saccharolyticus]|uniref:glycoside hydrolase family 65 protein n=1 Tax=Enterococcus saccharolyticus TaxID=41997 RepID=UPI001E2E5775|nr:glycosyl hydrolase family 65 protein [Enterococcus saccharolyticus]MCD5002056.1 glycoside hydrolase family 65 protein [Enterococcus saccharolyticus]
MTKVHLQLQPQWQATWADGTQTVFEGELTDRLAQLVAEIPQHEVTGGTVETESVVNLDGRTIELSQYLTETLNIPFVVGDFETQAATIPWEVVYHGYTPGKDEYSVESLLTVGNGFMGLRGTTPEMEIAEENYPALYLASLYNSVASQVADRTIYNEDFVNAPNLQKMYLVVDGERVDIANNTVLSMKRRLDLKTGLFEAWVVLRLTTGKELAIHTKKIASMANVHQFNISYTFTPLNFSGEVLFVSEADGDVYNYNVARYRSLTHHHLDVVDKQVAETNMALTAVTTTSKITVVQQAKLHGEKELLSHLTTEQSANILRQQVPVQATEQTAYTFEKTVHVHQYRQEESVPPIDFTQEFPTFEESYQASAQAWADLWETAGIEITGDLMSQKMLNLHTFHLLASASPNGNQNLDASVTARGLHGEAYRGHIFWDELFILPFYTIHFPETAKELLMYRYRRLDMAKKDAQKAGYQGAMFPWQSGLDGTEQSQELHLNPISGEWKEDHSRLQRHVSLAIAYNVWQYWHNTQDTEFMAQYGLEMLLEIAHFWQSAATFDTTTNRYFIDKVMGPDEFHENYPNSEQGGLKNNAYTNMMVVWLFEEIAHLHQEFPASLFQEIQEKTGVDNQTLESMAAIKHQLGLEINEDGIIAQFEGYFDLDDLDWAHYQEKYGNIYRMDRILNAEGKSADTYKVAKQADSLMIFYNFSKEQVRLILEDLDYTLPEDYVERNLHYYLERTSHGSTLSRVVHAQLAAMVDDQELAWKLYQEALYSDYRDIQGGTTAEGIHAGVMAATLYIPLTTFAGLDIRTQRVSFAPNLPAAWETIDFQLTIRQVNFQVAVTKETLTLNVDQDTEVDVNGQTIKLVANQPTTINY